MFHTTSPTQILFRKWLLWSEDDSWGEPFRSTTYNRDSAILWVGIKEASSQSGFRGNLLSTTTAQESNLEQSSSWCTRETLRKLNNVIVPQQIQKREYDGESCHLSGFWARRTHFYPLLLAFIFFRETILKSLFY